MFHECKSMFQYGCCVQQNLQFIVVIHVSLCWFIYEFFNALCISLMYVDVRTNPNLDEFQSPMLDMTLNTNKMT